MSARELRVAVTAPDYDEALTFYRDALGLREREAFASEDGRVTILEAGVATLELLDPSHAAFVDEVEVGRRVAPHIRLAFEVDDSAGTTRALEAAGATVIAEPTRTPWNSLNARLDGPAGIQLTLFEELGARMAIDEAQLEDVGSGLAPVSPGWFVVNAADAAWVRSEAFGGRCVFESTPRVLAERPDVEPQYFTQTGFTLAVLEPGKPSGMYHAESGQEDFLVLSGSCLLIIEEHERELRAWDFVHCPPGTRHTFVGTGEGPCVIFMTGARSEDGTIVYPRSDRALAHDAGVETETPAPSEAYARFPPWRPGRPETWATLPWA